MVELAHRCREAKVEEAKKMAEQEALDAKKATEANDFNTKDLVIPSAGNTSRCPVCCSTPAPHLPLSCLGRCQVPRGV